MRRILVLLAVGALMVALMVGYGAAIAFAANTGNQVGQGNQGPPAISGFGNPNTSSNVNHNQFGTTGACVNHRGLTGPENQTGGACP